MINDLAPFSKNLLSRIKAKDLGLAKFCLLAMLAKPQALRVPEPPVQSTVTGSIKYSQQTFLVTLKTCQNGDPLNNAWLGVFCLVSGVFFTNSLPAYTTTGCVPFGYPSMVCNEANLDLVLSLEQKIVVSERNELAVVTYPLGPNWSFGLTNNLIFLFHMW